MTLVGWQGKQIDNFTEFNYRDINIWWDKVARSFLQVNIDEELWWNMSAWGLNTPKYFYIRTETGDIYKVFDKMSKHLGEAVKDTKKWDYIRKACPTQRCIFNPKTGNLIGVENPSIKCWEPFLCASQSTTESVVEIVGVSGSKTPESRKISLQSTIEQEFKQQ